MRGCNGRSLTGLCWLAAPLALAPAPAVIRAEVGPFRELRGKLECSLYNRPEGFPRDKSKIIAQRRVPVDAVKVECSFAELKPGNYAIAVFHDRNDNGEIDTNFLGIPREAYGVTNNKTYALRPPRWEESKVLLLPQSEVKVRVRLRY